jgi:carbamoyltransferase
MDNIYILGISCYYHDSAAVIIQNGEIIAAAQEERFSRIKHDPGFPAKAISYCLEEAEINLDKVAYIVFYDKPFVKFERLLETYLSYAPQGIKSFLVAMPVWLKEKLFLKSTLRNELELVSGIPQKKLPKLLFNDHHLSHAASAFFPSPFEEAAIICLDGVGEWATSTVWSGSGNRITPLWQINFPHSLGLLYSAFTYYTGFKVNSGEYKLMGLAPYGNPIYVDLIKKTLIDIKDDGTFRLNMDYFNYATGLSMTNSRFGRLFGRPARSPETEITQLDMDLASSIQVVTEEIVIKLARTVKKELGVNNLCLAGGVALNCVANGKLYEDGAFDEIWIQPAAGDAGGALGAAHTAYYQYLDRERHVSTPDSMQGSYLGKKYSNDEIVEFLSGIDAPYTKLEDDILFEELAKKLNEGNVVGWFNGRMEFGPRALGGRSILGDPRNPEMQKTMNLKIKYRESFRPFAPAVKDSGLGEWFEADYSSPYMLFVAKVKKSRRKELPADEKNLFGIDKLNVPRSEIPAVTHVDYSARIQTVHKETNPRFYKLIDNFDKLSGCPVLINTSFNVRGEPIVCSPEDAYRCFMRSEIDYLVMENIILSKEDQPVMAGNEDWKEEFQLD